MTTRMRTFGLCAAIALLSWAIVGGFIGCSNEKQQITPPVVGPAAGSGPMGGGDTQSLQLTASPSKTLTTLGEEQGKITVTALIENSIGQPMPDGTPVYWSSTEGTIAPTIGTSSNGASEATITFPQGFDGCVDVTARSGDVSAKIRLCVSNVEATPTPAPTAVPTATPATPATPSLQISANPLTIVDGAPATTALTVCALGANGNLVSTAVTVTLTVTTGSGTFPSLFPTTAPTTVTVNPCETFNFAEGGTGAQTITIQATAVGATSDSVVITVTP